MTKYEDYARCCLVISCVSCIVVSVAIIFSLLSIAVMNQICYLSVLIVLIGLFFCAIDMLNDSFKPKKESDD